MPKYRKISWVWNGYGVCSNLASSGEPLLHMTTLTTAKNRPVVHLLYHVEFRRCRKPCRSNRVGVNRVKKIKCAILLLQFRRGAHLPS